MSVAVESNLPTRTLCAGLAETFKKMNLVPKVLSLSFFFFSLTLLHMYLCRMVWLNHMKIKFNEQKIILKESLNSYLYISYNLHICKYTFLYVKVTSSCLSGYEEVELPWKGGVCCLGGCESRTLSCFHFQLSVGQGSSLGTMCLCVLDICFSALRI